MRLALVLQRISGSDDRFDLEHRVFNTLTFSTTFLCLLAAIINSQFGFSLVGSILALLGSLISFFLFYLARIKYRFNNIMLFTMVGFAMLLIGVVFPFDGGSQSPLAFVFISLVHVFIIISNNRTQTVVFFLMLFTMTSLYGFEYYQPELINNNYPDPQTRLLDFIFTMGYSLFFILMTTLVFKKSYNRERKRVVNQNEELTQLNRKMVEKTKQIETLMKELSHRVKNNLQVVTSLLNLQSNRIKDPEAKAALLDGRNRLISMILLHQKLYITDKPTVVEMKEYIHDLAYVLLESNRPDRELLVLNLDEISLKIESAVPLGLILNELITNSLKYAFINESSSDRIEISFLRHEKNLVLTVKDNGVGFTRKNNSSFGLQLVDSLTAQLEATCEMISASGMTTIITLTQND